MVKGLFELSFISTPKLYETIDLYLNLNMILVLSLYLKWSYLNRKQYEDNDDGVEKY